MTSFTRYLEAVVHDREGYCLATFSVGLPTTSASELSELLQWLQDRVLVWWNEGLELYGQEPAELKRVTWQVIAR